MIALLMIPILIAIVLSYFLFHFIKKKKYNKWLRLLALLPLLIVLYFFLVALFPGEDFYRQDFKKVAGIDLPKDAEFIYKSATYPDIHGDYTSVSIINVGPEFYAALPEKLEENGLTIDGPKSSSTEIEKAFHQIGNLEVKSEYFAEGNGIYRYIGFLSDKKTILVVCLSW